MGIDKAKGKQAILDGKAALGIEFGSTRIKAVLVDQENNAIATGGYGWENQLTDNIWTYALDDVWKGIGAAYQALTESVLRDYDTKIESLSAIGISGMMHGYLAFDQSDSLLVPFRTWRNNITGQASEALTALFNYPVPQRWSIAHLYQAILNGESHVKDISFLTTLAGYVHWQLTGEKVMGVGEASGMFPIDIKTKDFNKRMLEDFDKQIADQSFGWKIGEILPEVLCAGQPAGQLSETGAALLDTSGTLKPGVPMCPPEGDAGTGMVATNSIAARTGNVSAGTSVFACVVLEDDLTQVYPELDQVTTPDGKLVAMAHSNNCTSDLNAWVDLFEQAVDALGFTCSKDKLFETLYNEALKGDKDAGGLLSYGYISGEHITHFEEGRPLFVRGEKSAFTLANFMRTHLFTSLAAMRIGLDILFKKENVVIEEMLGHGGLFKTEGVGQRILAAATNVPVSVMTNAGEGGAWGMALLASFLVNRSEGETLDDFLKNGVFKDEVRNTIAPDPEDVAGYSAYMDRYVKGLTVERTAVEQL